MAHQLTELLFGSGLKAQGSGKILEPALEGFAKA
jgi:hypothetical protein